MIDYREKLLRIVDQVVFLTEEEDFNWIDSPDSQLAQRILIVNDKSIKERSLHRIAKEERETSSIGTIPKVSMKITLNSKGPVIKRPYPIPESLKNAVHSEIRRLLEEGIIRKARSPMYASPAFPIQKKNNSIRLVVDYREINKRTIKDGFPFPNVREQLQSIPKSSIFSQLDLKQGYHQILLDEDSRKYTAFVSLGAL